MINEQSEYNTSLKADGGLPLAPLIDMVFLIVIFFMVNASIQFSSSILVELPEVQNSSSNTVIETVITVTENLAIYIESERISQSVDLITMQSILSSNSATKVILRADVGVTYGKLMQVMDGIRNAGITDVALQTVPVSSLD